MTVTIKRYLFIAGQSYYPEQADRDWIGFFDSEEEIESKITKKVIGHSKTFGDLFEYTIDGQLGKFDWYEIIDMKSFETK